MSGPHLDGYQNGYYSGGQPAFLLQAGRVERDVSNQPSVVATKREALFQKLEQALAVVSTIKDEINALSSVNQLPPEVIAEIFSILRYVQTSPSASSLLGIPRKDTTPPCVKKLGWMVVMQVCASWRSLAINTPTLWNNADWSLGPSWARRMLSYSKSLPISVRMVSEKGSSRNEDDPELIASHLSHIDNLHLSVQDSSWMGTLLNGADAPAPFLKKLDLRVEDSPWNVRWTSSRVCTAPNDLFGCLTPNLRDIKLLGVFIPWTSPLFKGLNSLHISLPYQPPLRYQGFAPTLTQFLDALDNMPDLKFLTVEGALPNDVDPQTHSLSPASSIRRAQLPRLASLELGGKTLGVALALSRVSIPLKANILLNIKCGDEPIEDARMLLNVLSHHLNPSGREPVAVNNLLISTESFLEINAYPGGDRGSISFEIHDDVATAELLQSYFETLPFRPISTVEWNVGESTLSTWEWQQIFGRPDNSSTTITSLTFSEFYQPGEFCAYLCGDADFWPEANAASQPTDPALLPLPALKTLVFEQSDFCEGTCAQSLIDAVQFRKQAGKPLKWLVLGACSIPDDGDEWLETLESMVESLELEDPFDDNR